MKRFALHYELDDGKDIIFEFDPEIDFDKYNKAFLNLYGKKIKRRYVLDKQSNEVMNIKKLKTIIQNCKK